MRTPNLALAPADLAASFWSYGYIFLVPAPALALGPALTGGLYEDCEGDCGEG